MGAGYLVRRGGGSGLNFKVAGGMTAPTAPAANTIWVNTATAISRWEFYKFTGAPSWPMIDGFVYFAYAAADANVNSGFNALKKNAVYMQPITAFQYVSGVWVKKTAKIYKNGAWVDWTIWLFNTGNQYTDTTGGWSNSGYSYSGIPQQAPTISETIYVRASSDGMTYCSIAGIANAIDLTAYNTLKVVCTQSNAVLIYVSLTKNIRNSAVSCGAIVGTNNVDISALSGSYYISVGTTRYDANPTTSGTFTQIWLE